MQIQVSPFVVKELKKIKRKDKRLAGKIEKQLLLFQSNSKHPSLRIHKLTGKQEEAWSISVTRSIRIIYKVFNDNTIYFIDIGSHDEVYRV